MYAIIVYDVSVEKVSKVCQFLRQHMNWIQNSVFEGEITESQLAKIEHKIKELINEEKDTVVVFTTPSKDRIEKKQIGKAKNEPETII
jgi:CRISPR-associated protein Cas2